MGINFKTAPNLLEKIKVYFVYVLMLLCSLAFFHMVPSAFETRQTYLLSKALPSEIPAHVFAQKNISQLLRKEVMCSPTAAPLTVECQIASLTRSEQLDNRSAFKKPLSPPLGWISREDFELKLQSMQTLLEEKMLELEQIQKEIKGNLPKENAEKTPLGELQIKVSQSQKKIEEKNAQLRVIEDSFSASHDPSFASRYEEKIDVLKGEIKILSQSLEKDQAQLNILQAQSPLMVSPQIEKEKLLGEITQLETDITFAQNTLHSDPQQTLFPDPDGVQLIAPAEPISHAKNNPWQKIWALPFSLLLGGLILKTQKRKDPLFLEDQETLTNPQKVEQLLKLKYLGPI